MDKILGSSTGREQRKRGDSARDRNDWREAAQAYQQYLEVEPHHWEIWIQLGHAVKEQGNFVEAETAYRRAAALAPADADSRIHLGHLLKRLGRPRQAAAVFLEASQIHPSAEVFEELKLLGFAEKVSSLLANVPATETATGRYLELKDLFQYLGLHVTVTGITRVVLALVNYLLEELDEAEAVSYNFVHQFGDAEGLLLLPKQKLRQLVRMATSETADLALMIDIIADMRRSSPLVQLKAGDLYFIPGAFWEFVVHPSWVASMRRRGVYIGIYVYDLIPISHSHYCMAPLSDAFNTAFAETVRLCDFALTISEFVARQVRDFLTAHHIRPFPVVPVLLAHELQFATSRRVVAGAPTAALDSLNDRPFVLCVCTLEARKNHIYLFYIWQRMIDAGIDVPDLVFVGRPGWRISDLLGQIEASRNLDGRLHVIHGLSDADLSTLYERCLFSVFPSFVEGWGLPVGESLAHGKVCVASSTTSIPEVGGDLVVYIDPFNLETGYQAIIKLISQPAALTALETRIRKEFVPRTWKDVAGDFCSALDGALSHLPVGTAREVFAPRLGAGVLLDMNELMNAGKQRGRYPENPIRLICSQGWRGIEATGTWATAASAELRFSVDYEVGREISILVRVSTSPWVATKNTFRVWSTGAPGQRGDLRNEHQYAQPGRPDKQFWIRLRAKVTAGNIVTIHFQMDGAIVATDTTSIPVTFRFHAIGYSAADDYATRINLLEETMFLTGG